MNSYDQSPAMMNPLTIANTKISLDMGKKGIIEQEKEKEQYKKDLGM